MATLTWFLLISASIFALTMATTVEDNPNIDDTDIIINSSDQRQKRSMDPDFRRRYNHLKYEYRDNPLAFTFLKYFLRNRGQRRERRQVNNFDVNNGRFNNPYLGYSYSNQQPSVSPTTQRAVKRDATRRRKPFRPPMVFF